MRAWTADADDIRVAEDFDESRLHRTPEIDGFLAPERDDKFIVIGTKGFGKTLLLKAIAFFAASPFAVVEGLARGALAHHADPGAKRQQ
jgi:DNA replication protein DnaC